jgi:hypothetical protein
MPVGTKGGGEEARAAARCLARLYLPRDDAIITADPSPENLAWLRAAYPGRTLRFSDADALRAAILAGHGEDLKQEAVEGLARRLPELSARQVITRPQAVLLLLLGAGFVAGLLAWPQVLLRGAIMLLSVAFVASGLFRALLAWLGSGAPARQLPLPRRGLPRYTILVPMYREAAVLPGLAKALARLDYPADLLDIKLVLEADDAETIAAAEAIRAAGAGHLQIVLAPDHGPRTKPKAANYALQFARGEYLVIYDAEDRPEPDQLLKAVAAFRAGARTLACVQARLNFYNADHNWLTNGIMAQTPLALV